MNIKKQISRLYLYEVVSGLQIVDTVWVFFLLQRGFSLAQVGIAEGVFHAVSMCFEIPSGMVSDTIGIRVRLLPMVSDSQRYGIRYHRQKADPYAGRYGIGFRGIFYDHVRPFFHDPSGYGDQCCELQPGFRYQRGSDL